MDAGNAGHGLGQAQKYDGVKTVIEIQSSKIGFLSDIKSKLRDKSSSMNTLYQHLIP
jgi:hypothetical protein